MHRTTRSLAALAFALAALAAAPARADVVVEDLQTPPGVDQWERAPQGPPPPRSRAIATLAFARHHALRLRRRRANLPADATAAWAAPRRAS